jgi:hypothetical protein
MIVFFLGFFDFMRQKHTNSIVKLNLKKRQKHVCLEVKCCIENIFYMFNFILVLKQMLFFINQLFSLQ